MPQLELMQVHFHAATLHRFESELHLVLRDHPEDSAGLGRLRVRPYGTHGVYMRHAARRTARGIPQDTLRPGRTHDGRPGTQSMMVPGEAKRRSDIDSIRLLLFRRDAHGAETYSSGSSPNRPC
jgi:hypothetical protein